MKYKMAFSTIAPDGKIPPGSDLWPKFNASFVNQELEMIEIANEIYTGHPFTTWHRNKWRNNKNYEIGQHIGIDFDTEDERSSLQYLRKDKFAQKYAAMIYTTPSHTVQAPRARVLFVLDTPIHQAKNYADAVAALLWLFGTADRQCKDPCRFFYGSLNCDIEYLQNELPLEKVKQIIKQYKVTGQTMKRTHERSNITATPDQEEVADALKSIQPWSIDYDEWLRVLMALHHSFGDSALPLAESWADGTHGEVQRKWRSFNSTGNTTGAVTPASIFKLARENGWQGAKLQ